jgi:hypothetical protein
VAAALHQLGLDDGIVLECGGTSSNVSIVKNGRTALRTLRVMGRPTSIRSVDSWVVGAAGGSMARLGRRKIEETGPRSAHIAGLPYACYAGRAAIEACAVELEAPRPGDPEQYAVVVCPRGTRFALTATCAAHALGLVDGAGEDAAELRDSALAGFEALARRMRCSPEAAARALLDRAVDKIAQAAADAARAHDFGPEVPLVALGGAGPALVPEVARRLGRSYVRPDNPEILSSIGAALSLVRAEVACHDSGPRASMALARDAERACVAAGAAPQTVQVETSFEPREGVLRSVATGAVALESGAAERPRASEPEQLRAAIRALGMGDGELLELVARSEFFRVYSENGSGRVAVVDGHGSVPFAENAKRVIAAESGELLVPLGEALAAGTVNLGVATLLPRVAVVCGPHLVDLSDARRPEDVLAGAQAVIEGRDEAAVAVIWQ